MPVSSTTKRLHLLKEELQSHPKLVSEFSDSYYSLHLRQTLIIYVNRTYEHVVSERVITAAAFPLPPPPISKSFHYAAICGERLNVTMERTQFNHRPCRAGRELGNLLTPSGLMRPVVTSNVFIGFSAQAASTFSGSLKNVSLYALMTFVLILCFKIVSNKGSDFNYVKSFNVSSFSL
jgi:hypothetical protein